MKSSGTLHQADVTTPTHCKITLGTALPVLSEVTWEHLFGAGFGQSKAKAFESGRSLTPNCGPAALVLSVSLM